MLESDDERPATTASAEEGESMKGAASILGRVARQELTIMKIALFICLLITPVSGCSSVINNSENFYRDIPRRPINWREYLTD
jgi:hypothetical protein